VLVPIRPILHSLARLLVLLLIFTQRGSFASLTLRSNVCTVPILYPCHFSLLASEHSVLQCNCIPENLTPYQQPLGCFEQLCKVQGTCNSLGHCQPHTVRMYLNRFLWSDRHQGEWDRNHLPPNGEPQSFESLFQAIQGLRDSGIRLEERRGSTEVRSSSY
jgi:hypothetical protein